MYEVARGARHASLDLAIGHALDIVSLERRLHVFAEAELQHALGQLPALLTVVAFAYPVLHALGTVGVLIWVYRSRPAFYPSVRTALVAATALALVGYVAFPVAPPRLAGLGIADTVTAETPLDLSSSVLGRLYNPLAAVPSLHFAYALLMGTVLVVFARRQLARVAGLLLPVVTLVVIVTTGNHFFADAAAGAIVAMIGLGIGVLTCSSPPSPAPPAWRSWRAVPGH